METKHASYNLHNYVKDSNMGFDQKPFNEVDGLVLTQIANMNFDNLGIDIHSGEGKSIQQICKEMHVEGTPANDAYNSMGANERALIDELADSDRYKDMVLSNYVNNPVTGSNAPVDGFGAVNSEDAFMEQFAAVTITYKQDGETYNYMSFQATNDTTDGWTEDFAMLSRTNTQAQKDSVDYMNIVGRKVEGHIIGGGHSKGGNDFEYGYLFCDEDVKQRIEKGYIYDSPGVSDTVLAETDRYDDFQEIIKDTYICPQDSIIGQLLHENENATFIHSVESGFLEHDPYSWEIVPGSDTFVPDNQTELSILIDQATDDAVSGMTQEQRDALFEFVQYLMYNNGGESLEGIGNLFAAGWEDPETKINELWTVLSGAWNSMTEEEREDFLDSLGVLISAVVATAGNYLIDEIEQWAENQVEKFKNKVNELWNAAVNWAEMKKNEFRKFLENLYKSFEINMRKIAMYLRKLSAGYQHAIANPQIEVDTYKLSLYAQRLRNINTRITTLDDRLDSLYWRVGLLDLWNLMQADILTGYSWRLSRCANYLSDTATDFSNAENDLVGKLQ